MNTHHNFRKESIFGNVALLNLKVVIFYMLNIAALELQFAHRIPCLQIYILIMILSTAKEILRGVCSYINISDLRYFFLLLLWNIDVYEFLFQVEYFPSKFGQSVSEDCRLLGEKRCLVP